MNSAIGSPDNNVRRFVPVHTVVPGRARFQLQALYRTQTLKTRLENQLPHIDGIHYVKANTLTGNVLIHFDPATPVAQIAALLESELADLPPSQSTPPKKKPASQNPSPNRETTRSTTRKRHQPSNPHANPDPPSEHQRQGPHAVWHTLDPETILGQLGSSAAGLSSKSAASRLARYGPNVLPQAKRRSDVSLFLEQFATPPVAMLGISAAVSLLTGGMLEAVAIVSVVSINALIGFFTERQSERTIASLLTHSPREVSVLRDDDWREVPMSEVVLGDITALRPGNIVAADARLLEAERLSLDESALTGESLAAEKQADAVYAEDTPLGDRRNMVYMGTLVTGGSGRAIVVGTALNSEIGHIQALASGAKPPATVVERQLDELGTQLVWLSSGICAAVFGVGLLRGYGWLMMMKSAISLAVAAVPEGLPTVATITLALGIRDMRRHKVLIRRLDAIETLGSVQFFCFDKTGTLTLNRMTVVSLHIAMERIQVSEERFFRDEQPLDPLQSEALRRCCEVLALCNEIDIQENAETPPQNGSATEIALLELARQAGLDIAALRQKYPRLTLQHRAENRPYMVSIHQETAADTQFVAIKGSPEHVLDHCQYYLHNGEFLPLDDAIRRRILQENARMAGEALRVLGIAYKTAAPQQEPFADLVWLGLAGMMDPLRPGMDRLLHRFHTAGIKTAMITGDQSATAYAIAKQLNLANGQSIEILDSNNLETIDPDLLSGVVQRVQVFARVSPAHKLQIVQALQQAKQIVAMTGDGINDGPALKAADMGVAMGGGANTEIAQSLADIVLADDNLETMEVAVSHGRTIYANVRKGIRFLISTNLSEIEVMLAGIGLGLGQPLNPMQLLWINLITDIFPGLALAMEAPEADVMQRPPRDPQEPVIARQDLRRLGWESAVISGGALASYGYAFWRYGAGPQASTQAFMTLTLGQLLHALSSRSEQHTLLERHQLPPNPYLNGALGISLAAQLLTVLVPGLRNLLGTTVPTLTDGLVMGAGALAPLLINEITKTRRSAKPAAVNLPTQDHTPLAKDVAL